MQLRRITGIILAAALSCTTLAIAQDAKDSMKDAGHETKDAAKDAGHGVKQGTKKSYHATKHVTKKAYHKTATGTENVGRRMDGKEPVPNNPK
jgi:hypothetical protein